MLDKETGETPESEARRHKLYLVRENVRQLLLPLQAEVSEEEDLKLKHAEIMQQLEQLENSVKQKKPIDQTEIAKELDRLQMQMDLLKVICERPRQDFF